MLTSTHVITPTCFITKKISDFLTEANFSRFGTGSDCIFHLIGGSRLNRTEKIFVV